jgi:uncharacterized membrane protein YgcG
METLDDQTVERLLAGTLAGEDARYGGVAALLATARAEARATTSPRAAVTIAAMVAAAQRAAIATVPTPPKSRRLRSRIAVGAGAGALALFGGLTAAGALPSAAQSGVSSVLAHVGIDVPRGHGHEGAPSKVKPEDTGTPGEAVDPTSPTNHGQCVSEVAGSGGEAVSEVARSDCGKDAKPPDDPGNGPPGGAPPGQVKEPKTPPTHPPQSNSGGSGGSGNGNANGGRGSGGSGNGNANGGGQGSGRPDK